MQAAGSVSISGILDRVLQRRRWAHIVETRRDGVFRGICGVVLLAKGAGHSLRNASCSSSRKTSVAAPRDLIRGSLMLGGGFLQEGREHGMKITQQIFGAANTDAA